MADAAKNNGKENEDKMNSMRDKLEDLESELAAARKKVLTMIKFYSVSTTIFTEYLRTCRNFFSLRMRHHAGRPTTGHCNGRRTITRKPKINRKSKRELLQKMNLTYLSQLMS